jgi:thiosulfate/3-mercaptopyruvate sulfurtransferase
MSDRLVSTQWLEGRLDDPGIRVVEICSTPDRAAYFEGHVPGAVGWFWKDCCWHETDREFVSPEALARQFGEAGIDADATVVLYGDPVQYANYTFWAFTMAGDQDLRVLDGGRNKWLAEDRPLSRAEPEPPAVNRAPGAGDAAMRIGRDDIRANLGRPGRLVLDVRSPEEYAGERVMPPPDFDHGAERAGRIPGAAHLYFRDLLNDDDSFRPAAEMQARCRSAGATPEVDEIVVYCRLSHRATLAWSARHRPADRAGEPRGAMRHIGQADRRTLSAGRPPGRDADRGGCEICGLGRRRY